jgi:hypothetical protein
MKTITKPVTVHSCLLDFNIKVKSWGIEPGERYVATADGYFKQLPKKCNCKKMIMLGFALDLIKTGRAEPIYKQKSGRMEPDMLMIWMAQQRQVPRIDLITRPDIERAYLSDDPDVAEAARFKIEQIHLMHMEDRLKLFAPFPYVLNPKQGPEELNVTAHEKDGGDPFEGKVLIDTVDERTEGGHDGSN